MKKYPQDLRLRRNLYTLKHSSHKISSLWSKDSFEIFFQRKREGRKKAKILNMKLLLSCVCLKSYQVLRQINRKLSFSFAGSSLFYNNHNLQTLAIIKRCSDEQFYSK